MKRTPDFMVRVDERNLKKRILRSIYDFRPGLPTVFNAQFEPRHRLVRVLNQLKEMAPQYKYHLFEYEIPWFGDGATFIEVWFGIFDAIDLAVLDAWVEEFSIDCLPPHQHK